VLSEASVKMDAEPISVTMDSGTDTPIAFPVVLKKIMEIPPPNLLEGDDGGKCLCLQLSGARSLHCRILIVKCILYVHTTTDQVSLPLYVNTERVFVLFTTWFGALNVANS